MRLAEALNMVFKARSFFLFCLPQDGFDVLAIGMDAVIALPSTVR